jgi:hypothetical protein
MSNFNGAKKTLEIYDNGELIFEEVINELTYGRKFKFENVKSMDDIYLKIVEENGAAKFISAL